MYVCVYMYVCMYIYIYIYIYICRGGGDQLRRAVLAPAVDEHVLAETAHLGCVLTIRTRSIIMISVLTILIVVNIVIINVMFITAIVLEP